MEMDKQKLWDLIKTRQQENINIASEIIKANPTIMVGDKDFFTIMELYNNDLNRFLINYIPRKYYINDSDIFRIPSCLVEDEKNNTIQFTFTNCNIFDLAGVKTLYKSSQISFYDCDLLSITPLENAVLPNIVYKGKLNDYETLRLLSKSTRNLTILNFNTHFTQYINHSDFKISLSQLFDIDLCVKGNEIAIQHNYDDTTLLVRRVF